jgi:transcriptional regulator with XRE-family HTH domain
MASTRTTIAKKVRALRQDRKLAQAELAARLGLSQSRLSQVERGDGSFTAEQFVEILRLFNVPVSHFVELGVGDDDAMLQNALARLGASHLRESPDVLVSPRLEDVAFVVRDALLSGSPRHITALAPVLVVNIDKLRLDKLRANLAEAGLERRLLWLLDNVRLAVRAALEGKSNRRSALRYGRALVVLDAFFKGGAFTARLSQQATGHDVLDTDIRGEKSFQQVWGAASEVSKRWDVVTALKPDDFRLALEAADVAV